MKVLRDSNRFLLFEDNKGDVELIKEYLSESEADVTIDHAETFKDAKKLLNGEPSFDCVLLDINLPDAKGVTLIEDIISLARGIPVIVLTGHDGETFGANAISMGLSDYLVKDNLTPPLLIKSIAYSVERKLVTNSLLEAQKQYRDLFDQSPLPKWIYDEETLAFLDVNRTAINHYGYSRKEFLEKTIKDIRPEEEIPKLKSALKESSNDGRGLRNGIFTHQKKDGSLIKVQIESRAITFQGRPARMVVAEDMTEELYYKELQILERTILERNALGADKIQDIAKEFALGIEDLHQHLRCSIMSVNNGQLQNFASPSMPDEYLNQINGLPIGTKVGSCGTAAYTKELVIAEDIRKDPRWEGYEYLGEKYGFRACWSQPIHGDDEEVLATFAMYYDEPQRPTEKEKNTIRRAAHLLRILFSQQEKRKAEEQLALSEQRFRSLVQDGSDLIAILDEEGFYKYVAPNREITLGIAASEFEGKHIRAFLHPDDEDQIIDKLNVLKRGDHIKIGPIRIRGANNKWRWIEGTLTNMLHNPAVRGIVSNTSDITDRRNYELQLKKSLKEKETLLMEIHHRVKNNLAVVSGMMQLQAFESENRELRDKLFSSVSRIQTMGAIHEILYQSENFSQIDFTENIKKLTANISETFPKDIDISYAISPVELNINQAIPSSLVINEVITNAFKHAFTGHETGRLMVELEENQGEVKVKIKDNGNGLSNMPAKSNGESLGLKLIDTLAQQLDADYSYSESDYGGTVFNFSFFKADYNGIGSAHL